MGDGADRGLRRVARPGRRQMPSKKEYDDVRSLLLSKIGDFYMEACERLAVRGRPVTLARFLDAGVCIGLLDPVSNIMANTLCTSDIQPDRRAKVLVGAAVEEKREEMGRRSLEGLVAFLLYFFPYFADWEAERYLLHANADLLAAARLIVKDLGIARFSVTSPASAAAFEAALALAAQVAKHPQPKHLVHVWMSLSSRLHQAHTLLSEVQHHSPRQHLDRLGTLLKEPETPELAIPWDLAASRSIDNISMASMPYQHTRALRLVLLDTIHCFYLKALAWLPHSELRTRFHRSLLRAGHCYGPMDPVSNIILNTIWYDVNFPAAEIPVLDMIGPRSLRRLESRSFYGLVSFLMTRYHHLSEHEAVRRLVDSCAILSVADPNLCAAGEAKPEQQQHQSCLGDPCAGIQEAYAAAAIGAWHPNPEEQAVFLASWKQGGQITGQLNSEQVQRLSRMLYPKQQPTPERICKPCYPARAGKLRSEALQRSVTRMVKTALDTHLVQDGKPMYDLHTICCVNEDVCGPEYCEDADDPVSFAPYKYHYSHVNFLATQKGSLSGDSYPILFFAEFDNKDGVPLVCCRVDEPTPFAEHVRCLYCEVGGAKIVHPIVEKFHGGGSELEEMIRGKHSLTNDWLICKSEYAVQVLYAVEEDFMYIDVN
ncbi:hypothetical protein ACP70R_003979 [Stipagrostis hirtigluma subsp. patula]